MQAKPTGQTALGPGRREGESRAARSQAVLLIESGPSEGGLPHHRAHCAGALHDAVLSDLMRQRAEALERSLPRGWRVLHAIHHGAPSIADALQTAHREGVERLIVLPVRPCFVGAGAADEVSEVYRCLAESASGLHVEVRSWWHDDVAYVDAHARLIHAFAVERALAPSDTSLAFWAAVGGRSPSPEERWQLEGTAERLRRRLGWAKERTRLILAAEDVLTGAPEDRGAQRRTLLVSLTHMTSGRRLETDLAGLVARCGPGAASSLVPCPPPDASEMFVKLLTQLARRGRQPMVDDTAPPLFAQADPRAIVEREIETLIMAGVCVSSPLGQARGPELQHCEHDELRRFKRPHVETLDLLRRVAESIGARECFIWNTCSRYELYAFLPAGVTPDHRRAMVQRAAGEVFGSGNEYANLLVGRKALHHALRTAAGLNSALVGDAEVVEQLRAAKAAAQYAGTAGELTGAFIDDIALAVGDLRERTSWKSFEHRYCDIALSRLAPALREILPPARCLVIGGSTTSWSALQTLASRFGVPRENLSLIYRGHRKGALVKHLHSAAGGPVTVVDDYAEPGVLDAIAAADLVIFAIDQRRPVFTLEAIAGRRAHAARPLLVLDFNTFGSVEVNGSFESVCLIDAARLDGGVTAFNTELLAGPALAESLAEAESWIACRAGAAPRCCGKCRSRNDGRCPLERWRVGSC